MPKVSAGLRPFGDILKDVNTLTGWGVKGTIAAPLVDVILKIGPPWPSLVPVITSLFELLVLMLVVTVYSTASNRVLRRLIVASAVFCVVAFVGYLTVHSLWVHEAPDGTRVVAGLVVRPDVAQLLGANLEPMQVLRGAGWDPYDVWTSASITAARLILFGLWFGAFGGFVTLFGAFALRQRVKKKD